jgi:single-stranded-DNA-specific exonuclease
MHRPKRWIIAAPSDRATDLAAQLRCSPIIAQVLLNRGLEQPDDCRQFLSPSLKCLHDPNLIPNLPKAAQRIARAIKAGEKIVIYGDYDVDGITATAILWHAIKLLGGQAEYYIPHRIDEGYGLNSAAIEEIIDRGAKLIVSVDCGVTAIEPAKVARARGVDLIITDHHEGRGKTQDDGAGRNGQAEKFDPLLPDCFTVVHPRLQSDDAGAACGYPNAALCGAGVAFKLAWGIGQACNGNAARVSDAFRDFLVEATALAALGTIADVVPLVNENRILASFGLGGLKASKLTGIQALIESAGLSGQTLDSYHVGFLLAPRLNASGRMGHARQAVEMLTGASHDRAIEIAVWLEQQNRQRQALERGIVEQAIRRVGELKMDDDDCRAIVLGAPGWHPGVIGIVASRLVDRFCKPAIVVAFNENGNGPIGQGSGRSINGFHLARALEHCSVYLEASGGHEMAAGLKVHPDNFESFRRCFCEFAYEHLAPEQLVPQIQLDAETELRDISMALVSDLQRLGPFGHGNRKPLFCSRGVQIASPPRRVGKTGNHLQLFLRQRDRAMKGIAFGLATDELCDRLKPGVKIDLAYEPTLNHYNGSTSVELAVKDLQFVG